MSNPNLNKNGVVALHNDDADEDDAIISEVFKLLVDLIEQKSSISSSPSFQPPTKKSKSSSLDRDKKPNKEINDAQRKRKILQLKDELSLITSLKDKIASRIDEELLQPRLDNLSGSFDEYSPLLSSLGHANLSHMMGYLNEEELLIVEEASSTMSDIARTSNWDQIFKIRAANGQQRDNSLTGTMRLGSGPDKNSFDEIQFYRPRFNPGNKVSEPDSSDNPLVLLKSPTTSHHLSEKSIETSARRNSRYFAWFAAKARDPQWLDRDYTEAAFKWHESNARYGFLRASYLPGDDHYSNVGVDDALVWQGFLQTHKCEDEHMSLILSDVFQFFSKEDNAFSESLEHIIMDDVRGQDDFNHHVEKSESVLHRLSITVLDPRNGFVVHQSQDRSHFEFMGGRTIVKLEGGDGSLRREEIDGAYYPALRVYIYE